jgi:hypothetical protein
MLCLVDDLRVVGLADDFILKERYQFILLIHIARNLINRHPRVPGSLTISGPDGFQ